MREWLVVSLAGGLGGAVATLVGQGGVKSGTEATSWVRKCFSPLLLQIGTLIVNLIAGSVASFVLWATYTSSLDFDSTKFSPAEVAAAVTVGLGGVGIVRGLVRQSEKSEGWKQIASKSATAADSYKEALDKTTGT